MKTMTKQMYVAQPSEKGNYEVAKWCEKEQNYLPLKTNLSEKEAKQRAKELNAEEQS